MRSKYSPEELTIIAEHHPDLDKLVELLPGRNRHAIRAKAGELGICKKRAADWTLPEIRMVERLYPDIDAIRGLLPHRTRLAIKSRGIQLGLTAKHKRWTPDHLHLLEMLCSGLSDKEAGAIMGVSPLAIYSQRKKMGLKKETNAKLARARVALVQDIRDEAERRGLQIGKITKALGCRRLRLSLTDTSMTWSSAAKVVSALGGELCVEWND